MDAETNPILRAVLDADFHVEEQVTLEGQEPDFASVRDALVPPLQEQLGERFSSGLYRHQARAIEAGLDGNDLCLATTTGSGKSLIFMVVAAQRLLQRENSNILALYPARALIQDQLAKWRKLLEPIGETVGYIDGGVRVKERAGILRRNRLVLMTPDVCHAWLMSHLGDPPVASYLSTLELLILDEAHVYEGVFGTNMAYFLRRLNAVAELPQIICSTATLGDEASFFEKLIGRNAVVFDRDDDRSTIPSKQIVLVRPAGRDGFEAATDLLRSLESAETGRFLAFADSRKMVEQLVASLRRDQRETEDVEPEAAPNREDNVGEGEEQVLPYRSGYETRDRNEIQHALEEGELAGVVSTSALELGIDIGDINLGVLLTAPPSMKAFWQRVGRIGRQTPGICFILDQDGSILDQWGSLAEYLSRPVDPNWLYLDNRYIQYANALCAALELKDVGKEPNTVEAFKGLPSTFLEFVDNEINPTKVVPSDLYPLKQRAQAGPHYEFPIRSGVEKEFEVLGPHKKRLGTVTFSQALREAYPGAIYYYMARPYRVYRFSYRHGEIQASRTRNWTTRPISHAMVFPRFNGGLLSLHRGSAGFVAEAELQVSERVLGFVEQRGPNKETHEYDTGSEYSEREVNRFFETTGVCWHFPDFEVTGDNIALYILRAYCELLGVRERDLGVGQFFARDALGQEGDIRGACIYDAVDGSLRLTKHLAERFEEVVRAAIRDADSQDDIGASREMEALLPALERLEESSTRYEPRGPLEEEPEEWATIIAPGERAMRVADTGASDITIVDYRYTPHGIMYEIESSDPEQTHLVIESEVQPIHGVTRHIEVNLVTGEKRDARKE